MRARSTLVHLGAASSIFALAGPVAEGVLLVARVGARLPGGPVLPESPVVRSAAVIAIASTVVAGVGARRRAEPRSRPQPGPFPDCLRCRPGHMLGLLSGALHQGTSAVARSLGTVVAPRGRASRLRAERRAPDGIARGGRAHVLRWAAAVESSMSEVVDRFVRRRSARRGDGCGTAAADDSGAG